MKGNILYKIITSLKNDYLWIVFKNNGLPWSLFYNTLWGFSSLIYYFRFRTG